MRKIKYKAKLTSRDLKAPVPGMPVFSPDLRYRSYRREHPVDYATYAWIFLFTKKILSFRGKPPLSGFIENYQGSRVEYIKKKELFIQEIERRTGK